MSLSLFCEGGKADLAPNQGEKKQLLVLTQWIQRQFILLGVVMGGKATRKGTQDKAQAPAKYRKICLSQGGQGYEWRISLERGCPRPLSRCWEEKKLVESNSGSSEYFPDPGNEKQAELGQAESLNIC